MTKPRVLKNMYTFVAQIRNFAFAAMCKVSTLQLNKYYILFHV